MMISEEERQKLLAEIEDELEQLRLEDEDLEDYYDSSVLAGCDCGCGGDTYMDSVLEIQERVAELQLKKEGLLGDV
jgi:hypothetical protein